jgi:predicted O-methyltransferase YrrM
MPKRGRPRKLPLPTNSIPPIVKRGRGRPPKAISTLSTPYPPSFPNFPRLPHKNPTSPDDIWENAFTLASTISDHYAMRPNEQRRVMEYSLLLNANATLVELGVCHGRTAAILGYAAKLNGFKYYGIDNFSLEGNFEETKNNLQPLDLPCQILLGNTHTIPWDSPIDFLLIDAGHDVFNIAEDCNRWLPFLKPGGLVCFHDYNSTIDPTDPHWGIKAAAERHCVTWETIDYIDWLLVKRKPLPL